jgi:threonine/homoserine/homoserine lactone efflux protein
MTNLLNPRFVSPELGDVWVQVAILVTFEFLVDGTVGLAGRVGSLLRSRRALRRGLNVAAGGLLIALGIRVPVEE